MNLRGTYKKSYFREINKPIYLNALGVGSTGGVFSFYKQLKSMPLQSVQ